MRGGKKKERERDKIEMLQAVVTSHKVLQAAQDICKCRKSKNVISHATSIA